jgi:hypothetical protein
MAKLRSQPYFPENLFDHQGIPINMCLNKTPEGKFQIARVLQPGGPQEGEFDVIWEGDHELFARAFARTQGANC